VSRPEMGWQIRRWAGGLGKFRLGFGVSIWL